MDRVITTDQADGISLQHLRRLAKNRDLAIHLQDLLDPKKCEGATTKTNNVELPALELEDSVVSSGLSKDADLVVKETDTLTQNQLHLLLCSSHGVSLESIHSCLSAVSKTIPHVLCTVPTVHKIPVPLHPPTSQEQAQEWSQLYWPTVYKKNNPNGPHPSIVSRATEAIIDRAGVYMAFAKQAAREAQDTGIGEAIGAVIANPSPPLRTGDDEVIPAIVVAAGDGRWAGCPSGQREGPGDPMAHAVMRAIALVARKRRELASQSRVDLRMTNDSFGNVFQDSPAIPVEHSTLSQDTLAPNGYLCSSMEIYVTHEPCVMCSMAILHSRFDKVVFVKRMPQTGAMAAESEQVGDLHQSGESSVGQGNTTQGSGLGLFWRDELNWKLLAWQFVELDAEGSDLEDLPVMSNVHA